MKIYSLRTLKKSILFFCFFILFSNSLFGQSKSSCHQLVFEDDKIKEVAIDSIGTNFVFFKKCSPGKERQRKVQVLEIREILNEDGSTSELTTLLFKSRKLQPSLLSSIPKWVFKHKTKKIIRSIEQGQKVKLTYQLPRRSKRTIKGYLKKINTESVIIETKRGKKYEFDRNHITKISVLKPGNRVGNVFGTVVLVMAGLAFGGLFMGAMINSIFPGSPGLEQDPGLNNGCLPVIVLMGVGFITLVFSNPKQILYPFNGDWNISSISEYLEDEQLYVPGKSEIP